MKKERFEVKKLRRLASQYNSMEADGGSDEWVLAHDELQDYVFDHIEEICSMLEKNRE